MEYQRIDTIIRKRLHLVGYQQVFPDTIQVQNLFR